AHFEHRTALTVESLEQCCAALDTLAQGQTLSGVHTGKVVGNAGRGVAFLFTGQGAVSLGMGRQLYETQPAFRRALDQCAALFRPYLKRPLTEVMYPRAGEDSRLGEALNTHAALFSVQVALTELWRSWGVEPHAVLGHSLGEYAAAVAAGVFSLEDGVRLVAARGRLMQSLSQGGMAAVFADADQVAPFLAECGGRVEIAAYNSPLETVISGDEAVLVGVLD